MKIKLVAVVMMMCLLVPATLILAQKGTDNVHLFQNFFQDAVVASNPYGEAGLAYGSFDKVSTLIIGAQGGYPVNNQVEIGVGLHYMNWSPEGGDSQGGLTDPIVTARYLLKPGLTQFSVGGYATLPVGSEDIGQGTLDFGLYGAVRHKLEAFTLTGTIGLDFVEVKTYEGGHFDMDTFEYIEGEEKTDHESSLVLGVGGIYPLDKTLSLVGELVMKTEVDYMMLSAGADYLMGNGRLRGALGLGLDDGAPDLTVMASYLLSF
jgi:hypothetical protein